MAPDPIPPIPPSPAFSPFRPVALQIAPAIYRPFYPFAAVIAPNGLVVLDGWLHCQPEDAFHRWVKDTNVPELPSRRNPFLWVERIQLGDKIGQYRQDLRLGDLIPITPALREASHA